MCGLLPSTYQNPFSLQKPPLTGAVFAFTEMAVSFNNKYLALFADTGLLWIGSSDLQVRHDMCYYICIKIHKIFFCHISFKKVLSISYFLSLVIISYFLSLFISESLL